MATADELVTGTLPIGMNHIEKNVSFAVFSLLMAHFVPEVSESIRSHTVIAKFTLKVSELSIDKIPSTPSNSNPLSVTKTGSEVSAFIVYPCYITIPVECVYT